MGSPLTITTICACAGVHDPTKTAGTAQPRMRAQSRLGMLVSMVIFATLVSPWGVGIDIRSARKLVSNPEPHRIAHLPAVLGFQHSKGGKMLESDHSILATPRPVIRRVRCPDFIALPYW